MEVLFYSTAASLSYGLDKKSNETILVFDLGGGSCNFSNNFSIQYLR